jgi:hypothetical protein
LPAIFEIVPRRRSVLSLTIAVLLFLLLSLILAFTYDARGQLAAMQDPLGRHVTMQWEWELLTESDFLG